MMVPGPLVTSLKIFALYLAVSALAPVSKGKSDNVRICVPGNPSQKSSHAVKSCEMLAMSKKTHATCVYGVDRLDCLRQVKDRKADMTVSEAEDLLFAAAGCSQNCPLLVVSEVRAVQHHPYEYEGVVVVRKSAQLRPDLKGASLCHPGWTPQDGRSSVFSVYLEDRLAPQSCNSNLSLLEDRIRTSASYFGRSCKPGAWSSDPEEDVRLKVQYSSLCAMCDDPRSCSTHDKFWGEGGSVTCLLENAGDALWTTYSAVRINFLNKLSSDGLDEYEFLCMDGRTIPLDTKSPCTWLARPWQVVVANSKMAADVQKALELLNDGSSSAWEDNLISVFDAHKEHIVILEVSKPPEDYLETIPGFLGANEQALANCNPPYVVTWCTASSIEHRKCTWIAQAAQSFGLSPSIHCQQSDGMDGCLKSVAKMESDIAVVPADYQPIALLQHNLTSLFFEDFKATGGGFNLVAIVLQESSIQRLEDLRHHRVCFTLHDGLAWRAALTRLRENGLVSSSCTATDVLQSFFSEVCVTGGESKLATCCGRNSTTDPDTSALQCLVSRGCDVAFVSNATLQRYATAKSKKLTKGAQNFRFICPKEESDCSWAWSAASAVMASQSLPVVRLQETKHIFSELLRLFARHSKAKNLVLAMFGPFEEENNVIFQDTSSDLTLASRFLDHRPIAHSMQQIFNETKFCSTATTPAPLWSLILLLLLLRSIVLGVA